MRITFDDMKKELKRVLLKKHVSEEKAETISQIITETSCDGVYSHGLNRFPRLIHYIEKGYIDINAIPTKTESLGALEQWDGNLGFGITNAKFCMDRAIELAKTNTIGCVALKNTNHWLRGGTYGWQSADAGCIGICWTNTIPNMPSWGAKDRKLGNNPLVLSVPNENGHIVVDLAMAQFSYGQLESHRLRGEELQVAGGYDKNGNLTTTASEIEETGRVLPIGYWKGSGLSLLLDLIAMILSGGNSAYKIGQLESEETSLSQIFIAIDTSKVASNEFLKHSVNEVINDLKSATRVDENQEIKYPGERTLEKRKENLEKGIPVDEKIWETVLSL